MNPSELDLGTYVLTTDCNNPVVTARVVHDWRTATTFTAGTVFYVLEHFDSQDGKLALRQEGSESRQVVAESDIRFAIIARYLEKKAEKPSDWLKRHGDGVLALAVLDKLFELKRIGWGDLQTALTHPLEDLGEKVHPHSS